MRFFGSFDVAWVERVNIVPYTEGKQQYQSKCRTKVCGGRIFRYDDALIENPL